MWQQTFDVAAEDMGLREPTIATPSLLKLILVMGFRMESRDDVTTGIHPFPSASTRPRSASSFADKRTDTPWWPLVQVPPPWPT